MPRRLTWIVGLALTSPAVPLSAQLCSQGRISEIVYDRRKPFGPEATDSEATFGWLYRGMNAIHVRSLPRVIRWELLFREGDCLDPLLLAESERGLRSLPYIVEATIVSEPLADGSHRVRVQTVDSWAVALGVAFTADDGFQVTGISVNAKNLLGTGTQIGYFRNVWRERQRIGLLARQPNLFGTRIDATIHGGSTRSGDYIAQSLFRPYAGEVGVHAFRQSFETTDDLFLYSTDPARGFEQAYLRYEIETRELTYQRRFGDPDGTRFIAGLGVSREEVRFPYGPSGVQIVVDDEFGDPVPAPTDVIEALSIHARDHEANRVSFTLGVRNLSFRNLVGLDALQASQDVPSGSDLTLTVAPGFGPEWSDFDDVLVRLDYRFGLARARSYLQLDADLQARNVASTRGATPEGWRDVMYEINGHAYWTQTERAQLFGRVQAAAGHRMDRPFQLTLGGREAVRGYGEDAYPGGRRVLVTLEQRLDLPALRTPLADLGLVAFADVGRGWAAGAPFGETTGWKAGIGAGIRAGIPAGASGVLRAELGTPLTGERRAKGAVFRLYVELLGILDRRAWPNQIERSRWYGVDPDLATRPVNPLAEH